MKKIIVLIFCLYLAGCSNSTGPGYAAEDVNRDGTVTEEDMRLVESAYGSMEGDERWNPYADIDKSGRIDGNDIYLVSIAI